MGQFEFYTGVEWSGSKPRVFTVTGKLIVECVDRN